MYYGSRSQSIIERKLRQELKADSLISTIKKKNTGRTIRSTVQAGAPKTQRKKLKAKWKLSDGLLNKVLAA